MKLKKAVLVFCCLVGCLGVANAQGGRGALKNPAVKELFRWSDRPPVEANSYIGHVLRQTELPFIGSTSGYARRAKWGEWMTTLSPKIAKRLIAHHIVEASFPGYIPDFLHEFRVFEEESDLSWMGELPKALQAYGPEAQFVGGFVPSLTEVVEFLERPGLWWTRDAKNALDQAFFYGKKVQSGFFVVAVRSPLAKDGKDILLLDPKERRFISVSQSIEAATPKSTYAPAPVGDVQIGHALINRLPTDPHTVYIADFSSAFEQAKKTFGVKEWMDVLMNAAGEDTFFYAQYLPSLREVVSFYPSLHYVSDYHGVGRYADGGRPSLEEHLYDVVRKAREEKGGFFVVFKMHINLPGVSSRSRTEEDVLILDLENKRFISLEESRRLAEE